MAEVKSNIQPKLSGQLSNFYRYTIYVRDNYTTTSCLVLNVIKLISEGQRLVPQARINTVTYNIVFNTCVVVDWYVFGKFCVASNEIEE